MNDRNERRLTSLAKSASTARVLNLMAIHGRIADESVLAKAPFFKSRRLDHCIILKHRLRLNEYHLFSPPRQTATKILMPIDVTDLKSGAGAFFYGQRNYEYILEDLFGQDLRSGSRDRQVLDIIDSLPSLDPFLLRETLRNNGIEPARDYFDVSDGDMQKMFDFVRSEITALANLSLGDSRGPNAQLSKFVQKLMSNAAEGFEPLKAVLKLSDSEYMDGVFSWRGFLYYKWVLQDLHASIGSVLADITQIQGRGPKDAEASAYIPAAKGRILEAAVHVKLSVEEMLEVYNKAYADLTVDGKPNSFREFLLSAPKMFTTLGERLGALQHIVSFWQYRFPNGKPKLVSPEELMGIFLDFEESLAIKQDYEG